MEAVVIFMKCLLFCVGVVGFFLLLAVVSSGGNFLKNLNKGKMKKKKSYSDCQTVDDFIAWYEGAGRRELKAVLKGLGGKDKHHDRIKSNERDAIIALLA